MAWLPGCLLACLSGILIAWLPGSKNLEIVKQMGTKNLQNGGPNRPKSSPEGAKRGPGHPKNRQGGKENGSKIDPKRHRKTDGKMKSIKIAKKLRKAKKKNMDFKAWVLVRVRGALIFDSACAFLAFAFYMFAFSFLASLRLRFRVVLRLGAQPPKSIET